MTAASLETLPASSAVLAATWPGGTASAPPASAVASLSGHLEIAGDATPCLSFVDVLRSLTPPMPHSRPFFRFLAPVVVHDTVSPSATSSAG